MSVTPESHRRGLPNGRPNAAFRTLTSYPLGITPDASQLPTNDLCSCSEDVGLVTTGALRLTGGGPPPGVEGVPVWTVTSDVLAFPSVSTARTSNRCAPGL